MNSGSCGVMQQRMLANAQACFRMLLLLSCCCICCVSIAWIDTVVSAGSRGSPQYRFCACFPIGITGYWLVWDKLGQLLRCVHLNGWTGSIVAEPIARNFLTNSSIADNFFRMLFIVHIAHCLFSLLWHFLLM